ncbi:MAG: sigma-70 family RNA polymerase sigma factor [Planctomycetes bacterium]|nr:sigma-70 family RNA polymerase sigma factor [Planctomycetota bacterium]
MARVVRCPGRRQQVEDSLWDALVDACLANRPPTTGFSGWLRGVARRLSFGRRKRDLLVLPLDFDPAADRLDPMEPSPRSEWPKELLLALQRMAPRQRAACEAFLELRSIEHAGLAIGMSKQNVHRAIRRLLLLIQASNPEAGEPPGGDGLS